MKQSGQRPSSEDMFARLDADASGSLDQSELQSMIDRMSEKMGAKAPTADEMIADLDSDGDGMLSVNEFEAGRPQGPPGGPPQGGHSQMTKETTETDLLQTLLDLFKSSDEEEDVQQYAGILA